MNGDFFLSALPIIPLWGVIGLGIGILGGFALCLWLRARLSLLRWMGMATVLLALLNLVLHSEERSPLADIATVIVDESASQQIGERPQKTEQALEALKQAFAAFESIELSIVRVSGLKETRLFDSLSLLPEQHAATILITDGQVHEIPEPLGILGQAPIHLLLSGEPNENDRRLTVHKAPRFGLVNQTVQALLLIEQTSPTAEETVLSIKTMNGNLSSLPVPIGTVFEVTLPVEHPGKNIFELSIPPAEQELTLINNTVTLSVNGIRDRLQVLMVSGFPYSGQRVWRNILKSDPSIDLIHFTILRTLENDFSVPRNEMSLISFPTEELFAKRLSTFDLVILDRYQRQGLIAGRHFKSLVEYVKQGGGLLMLNGPESLLPLTILTTELQEVLPVRFSEEIVEKPFYPQVTEIGGYHPVTRPLLAQESAWGQWFRQVVPTSTRGQTLLSGADDHPLLILDRVQDGRVAQLTSDQIWVWVRGRSGPYTSLLRRLIHWLMKEPELEENRLTASITDRVLTVNRYAMDQGERSVSVISPDQTTTQVPLAEISPGHYQTQIPVSQIGIYRIQEENHSAAVGLGEFNTLEYRDLSATDRLLKESVEKSGGGIYWINAESTPRVIHRSYGTLSGVDWLGVKKNQAYRVSGTETLPLLANFILLGASLFFFIGGWYRESG